MEKLKECKAHRVPTAIVAEGGGQRGIYTAGVLDAFISQQFNPFDIGIGASAGAQNLLTYFFGELGYAKRAIAELTAAPSFFVPYRWVGARGIIDLDSYFERTERDPEYRLPYQQLNAMRQHRRLLFVATSRSTLEPVYLDPDSQTAVRYLKASSAVPFLYKSGVQLGDQVLVDGSVADPIPVQQAVARGARRILVVRTVPSDTEQSSWRQRIDALRMGVVVPRIMLDMLDKHERAYADAVNFMRNPPAGVSITEISPESPLCSDAIGSQSKAMLADYDSGVAAGEAALHSLAKWEMPAQSMLQPA